METQAFEFITYGKWILAGEHAVLRGCPALVFPLRSCSLKGQWQVSNESLRVEFAGAYGEDLRLPFWGVLERALELVGQSRNDLKGVLKFESSLPLGTGLGASAAICVAIGRMWENLGWIKTSGLYEFARDLEDMFHGESSGVDIAAAMATGGLRFLRGGEISTLEIKWQPKWYLSYSGKRGVTSECVTRVKSLKDKDPMAFGSIDGQMREAVELAEQALRKDEQSGFDFLKQSIDIAKTCFKSWGLTEGELDRHMTELLQAGACAVKPTGSGGGGYVLSLWKETPERLPFSILTL